MQPFRATYKPRVYGEVGDFTGYDDNKAETVLVIKIIPYDKEIQADVAFIHSDGRLDVADVDCFFGCVWPDYLIGG